MRIISTTTSLLGSHMYFVIEGSRSVIIDPSDTEIAEQVVNEEALSVDYVLLTHEHCDHTYASSRIRDRYHCQICSSVSCSKNLNDERRNQSRYFEAFATLQVRLAVEKPKEVKPFKTKADITFSNEMYINWNGHEFYLRETPGHSEGSVCIMLDKKFLFSGDTLLWNELVNTRFPGGNAKQFEEVTLPWLRSLNSNIYVYPGHLEEFKIGDRLKYPIM